MHTKDQFFSSLEKLAEEPINGLVFVSTDQRDLPLLVKLIRSLEQKKELWASNVKLKNLLNDEASRILFIIKLITYGETSGDYSTYQTKNEVEKILTDATSLIEGKDPLVEKANGKIKKTNSATKGYRAPMT